MSEPDSGMVRGMNEFFKHYKGCRNCKYQIEPLRACEWHEKTQHTVFHLVCPRWEMRENRNDQRRSCINSQ